MPVLIAVFSSALLTVLRSNVLDPDLGWRLRLGQYMVQHHTLVQNFVGYNYFRDLHVIDHQWLSDILIYLLYNRFGNISLLIVSFLCILTAAYLVYLISKKRGASAVASSMAILIFFISLTSIFGGFRLQYIIFTAAALIMFVYYFVKDIRIRLVIYFLLFALGSNTHGGGFLVLVPLAVLLESSDIFIPSKRKILAKSVGKVLLILLILLFAMSINPYGIEFWKLMWLYVVDNYYKTHINEFLPIYSTPIDAGSISFAFLTALFFTISGHFKKMKTNELLLLTLFIITGTIARRALPLFFLIAVPYFAASIDDFFFLANTNRVFKYFFTVIISVVFVGMIMQHINILPRLSSNIFKTNGNEYPISAIVYLSQSCKLGNLLNLYYWGGYLSWAAQGTDIFVDGRAPMARTNEGNSILKVYSDTVESENKADIQSNLDRYNIRCVLIQKKSDKTQDYLDELITKYLPSRRKNNASTGVKDFVQDNRDWEIVHEDNLSILYLYLRTSDNK